MEEIINILKEKGFDLIYLDNRYKNFTDDSTAFMIWMKNNKYFIFECSNNGINELISSGVEINVNHWLKDLTYDDLQRLIDLGLPNIKETIREIRLKKLLGD
ncbi:MAG: hypothetical protein SLAVMIC_00624 [uncultured marine phage]|uniref:Uncharacterized protein n=1 Tax=uncultured marine phage TaxID=707152 RepID=A0A8D9C990_9VIRU|nr:MAG: hypothetical protein SLAVMIC_00624 [uncultured marine phage]